MPVLYISDPAFLGHDTGGYHPESADRLKAVTAALSAGSFSALVRENAAVATEAQMAAAHSAAYVETLFEAMPEEGYRNIDPDTVLSPGTSAAVRRAAGAAVQAVDAVAEGKAKAAFCAVRPPGHHAERNRPMGFCLVNNVAVAAYHARAAHGLQRIACVDFDVHHGNGTQDIFWDDAELFYASTHQFPHYPGTGRKDETGAHGNVVNVPLAAGATGRDFRLGMEADILPALYEFRPDLVLISAGFDAHKDDPLSEMGFEEVDFAWATTRLAEAADKLCGGRVVSCLEGGYNLRALGASVAAHVAALMDD